MRVEGKVLAVLIFTALLFLVPLSSQAATITYNGDGRPILFEGIVVDETVYDVTVTWGSSYNTVYASQDPIFLDKPWIGGAGSARNELLAAFPDTYPSDDYHDDWWLCIPYDIAPVASYPALPWHVRAGLIIMRDADVDNGRMWATLTNDGSINVDSGDASWSYGGLGYTQFELAAVSPCLHRFGS